MAKALQPLVVVSVVRVHTQSDGLSLRANGAQALRHRRTPLRSLPEGSESVRRGGLSVPVLGECPLEKTVVEIAANEPVRYRYIRELVTVTMIGSEMLLRRLAVAG
jgi:hypothetical protein